jgi:Tol biopolymer transport system component
MKRRFARLALLLCGVLAAALATAPAALRADPDDSIGRVERKVMFSACSPGHPGGPGLFVANSDFTNPIRLTTPRPDLPAADSAPGTASGCDIGAWSPDGTRVALSRNMYLYLLDLKALIESPVQEPVRVETQAENLLGGPLSVATPAWSPDGEWLVFHDGDFLSIMKPDGTGYRTLVPMVDYYPIREPEWSPDGRAIAFRGGHGFAAAGRPDGSPDPSHIFVVTNIGGPGSPVITQVTDDAECQDSWPHWSPDSSSIVFTSGRPGKDEEQGDVWALDLASGEETQLTDTPDILEQALGWCPFDGRIYYLEQPETHADPCTVVRMNADGTGVERFTSEVEPVGRITWGLTDAWIDSAQALPGEEITLRVGTQDSAWLSEIIADISYAECCRTLDVLDVAKGSSIPHWVMPAATVANGVLSVSAYAEDPLRDNVSGPLHLFDLRLANSPAARANDLQLLDFSGLSLGVVYGSPGPVYPLSGGVVTIPFAGLAMTVISKRELGGGDISLRVSVAALDRDGQVMASYNGPVNLGAYWYTPVHEYTSGPNLIIAASPGEVTLRNGLWTGPVTIRSPGPGARLLAYWGDIAAYSGMLVPKGE